MSVTLLMGCSTGVGAKQTFGDSPDLEDDEYDDEDDEAGDGDAEEAGDGDGDGDPDEIPGNAYCLAVEDWDSNWVDYEDAVIDYINAIRAGGRDCGSLGVLPPAPALDRNAALLCASRAHSGDMAERDYFDHVSPEGKDPGWRLEQAGYSGDNWAENIGGGYPLPTMVVDGWLESEVHCGNMLDPAFTQIGAGYAFGTEAAYAHYWTLVLGN